MGDAGTVLDKAAGTAVEHQDIPVADPEGVADGVVADMADGAGTAELDGVDQRMGGEVHHIDGLSVGAIDVLSVGGHVAAEGHAVDVEVVDQVAGLVVLVEDVAVLDACAPAGGVDVLSVGDHAVLIAAAGGDDIHQVVEHIVNPEGAETVDRHGAEGGVVYGEGEYGFVCEGGAEGGVAVDGLGA